MSAVRTSELTVRFGSFRAVDGLDLHVAEGEWLGLIGPNGSGKSTLLRAVLGLVRHDGAVEIDGRPRAEMHRREVARALAYVPQSPIRPPDMLVADYVLLGRTAHIRALGTETAHDIGVVATALERLDLGGMAGRAVGTLSGGEFQRVVLARALAQEASILFLDEPTSALDVGHQQQVLELVEDLREEHGLTVLSAMHDLTLAGQFVERLVLLSNGRLVATGTPAEVLTEHTISEHYGASVRVLRDECGGVVVVPTRSHRDRPNSDAPTRVHADRPGHTDRT